MPRRLAPLILALLVLAGACSSPILSRTTTPGTVHARVVTGGGGSRLLLVPVYVGSRGPYDFALDTGAARTVVDSRLASDLRLPSTGSEQAVTGVTGTSEAMRVRISSWRVDAVPLPDTTILSLRLASGSGPSLAGLLGSDMLSRFRTVTIDYESGTVTLR
ncbi:MAG TPA: aspartyl protease family protein [Candidatus Dormibacteraeota bacterium]|nr:aspartyl protease family protein [Candidatus Dormibacteraeota bacterium]